MPRGSTLTLTVPADFHFVTTVTTYGYYMLAPNQWHADTATLRSVVRDERGQPVAVTVRQTGRGEQARVRVTCDVSLSKRGRDAVRRQVARILRLDEPVERFEAWHRRCPSAARRGFGRLVRSATLFEDIVKTITGCNVAWAQTVRMNQLLCEHYGDGGFPLPQRLTRVSAEQLKTTCRVGYRAERILRLAAAVTADELDLSWFEQPEHDTPTLFRALRGIYGLGDYAAGNLCQHLGRYDRMAIDSETYRHFREVHGLASDNDGLTPRQLDARIHAHYTPYAPFQFLAYWYELWFKEALPP